MLFTCPYLLIFSNKPGRPHSATTAGAGACLLHEPGPFGGGMHPAAPVP